MGKNVAGMQKRSKTARPARDGERLLSYGAMLLLAAGEAVTPDALAAVARTAPRGEEESRSPCSCGRCASMLMRAEEKAKYGRFLPVATYFLEDLPSWPIARRAAAEEALARMLGA